jgi:hypothetical protein
MYQRAIFSLSVQIKLRSDLTSQLNMVSTPKKNRLKIVVMIITITVVIAVSRPVGHATRAVSARTCRMNSPGLILATAVLPILLKTSQNQTSTGRLKISQRHFSDIASQRL